MSDPVLDHLSILNLEAVLSKLPVETHATFVNLLRDAHMKRVLDGAWTTEEEQGVSGYILLATPEHTKWVQETEAKLKVCLKGPDKFPIPAAMIDKALLIKAMAARQAARQKQAAPPKPPVLEETPKAKAKKTTASPDTGASETMTPGDQDQNAKSDDQAAVA